MSATPNFEQYVKPIGPMTSSEYGASLALDFVVDHEAVLASLPEGVVELEEFQAGMIEENDKLLTLFSLFARMHMRSEMKISQFAKSQAGREMTK